MRLTCMLGLVFILFSVTMVQAQDPGKCWTKIEGKITSIDPVEKQIVVDGVTIQVTEDTKIVKEQEEIDFEDLEVDMLVRVRGLMKEKVLVACHICVKCEYTEIEGKITDIDPVELQIVVNDITVQVTKDTIIKMKHKIITFEDLEVGMTVKVKGEYDGDILVAKRVCVRYGGR